MKCVFIQFTHFSTGVGIRVVDKETDLLIIVALNESEQVILPRHGVRAKDIIRVRFETSLSCWGVGMNFLGR